tara:strand:- start:237 stop:1376 length:1140 start_codon:yes stop_codon:yes gene_type:complete
MKIGIIFAIYNCEEFIDECLEPWLKLRNSHNLILTATSGQFQPYQKLGIKNKNQKTISKLVTKELDYISTTAGNNLISEDSSRNTCLNFLKPHNCDVIWLVDGDELYTEKNIKDIINYVNSTPNEKAYQLYFKNYIHKYPYFMPPWNRLTLFRNNLYGGVKEFYFDAFFNFEEESKSVDDLFMHQVPKHIAHIEHHSWTSRDATIDKIKYQKERYKNHWNKVTKNWLEFPENGRCMCEEVNGNIYLSEKFYQIRGLKEYMPSIHEYPNNKILDCIILKYNIYNNVIQLFSEYKLKNYQIKIKDIVTEEIYYDQDFTLEAVAKDYPVERNNLHRHQHLWFVPKVETSSSNFFGYKIEISKNDEIFHVENIHSKLGILNNI